MNETFLQQERIEGEPVKEGFSQSTYTETGRRHFWFKNSSIIIHFAVETDGNVKELIVHNLT